MAETDATATPVTDNTNTGEATASEGTKETVLGSDTPKEKEGEAAKPDKFSISKDKPADKTDESLLSGDGKPEVDEADKDGKSKEKDGEKFGKDKSEEGESEEDGKTQLEDGAPEKYENFTVPEGYTLNDELLGSFTEKAKAANLTQAQAQDFLDMAVNSSKISAEQATIDFAKTREDWIDSVKADPDFGGAKFNETKQRAVRAMSKFGSPALKTWFAQTGIGDQPELIKAFARMDKETGEPLVIDGTAVVTTKDAATTIYPNQGKS